MKEVPANKKKSLGKLPTPVRNKMGYMEEGGAVPKIKKGSPSDRDWETDRPTKKISG